MIGHAHLRFTCCLYSRRILWEPLGSRDSHVALIWDVVKHKSMRRQAKYIDDADRPSRGTRDVLIVDYRDNSRANTLLPRYRVPSRLLRCETSLPLGLLKSMEWLKLSEQENDLARQHGYLCVKGRSGTGKTLISIHRMLLKARQAQLGNSTIRQAYVARNSHLCQSVKKKFPPLFQKANKLTPIEFFTMKNLVTHLEKCAVDETGHVALWKQTGSTPMRFLEFKDWYSPRPVPKSAAALTARQIWTEIQSIIQGTITCSTRTVKDSGLFGALCGGWYHTCRALLRVCVQEDSMSW